MESKSRGEMLIMITAVIICGSQEDISMETVYDIVNYSDSHSADSCKCCDPCNEKIILPPKQSGIPHVISLFCLLM